MASEVFADPHRPEIVREASIGKVLAKEMEGAFFRDCVCGIANVAPIVHRAGSARGVFTIGSKNLVENVGRI